jgi:hypothetical protein
VFGVTARAPLPAGSVLLRPTYNAGNRGLSGKRETRVDNREIAALDGPWGSLRVVLDGFPAVVSAHLGEEAVAVLRGTRETQGDDGPIPVSQREDVPLLLAGVEGGARFVAEGVPRPAGRSRYLRATVADESWTYGATETATAHRPTRTARLVGSSMASTQLRRGPKPAKGPVVVEVEQGLPEERERLRLQEGRPVKELYRVVWTEGAQLREVALTMVLLLGTDSVKLYPLWLRTFLAAGDYL